MGPGSKGQNGVAVVLASMGFVITNPLVRVSLRPYTAVRGGFTMRNRTEPIQVYLNKKEREKLDSLCKKGGTSYAVLFRKWIMETEIRERPSADFMALATSIDRLGTNINQIAKKANTNNSISYSDMKEVASTMRLIRAEMNAWKEKWL